MQARSRTTSAVSTSASLSAVLAARTHLRPERPSSAVSSATTNTRSSNTRSPTPNSDDDADMDMLDLPSPSTVPLSMGMSGIDATPTPALALAGARRVIKGKDKSGNADVRSLGTPETEEVDGWPVGGDGWVESTGRRVVELDVQAPLEERTMQVSPRRPGPSVALELSPVRSFSQGHSRPSPFVIGGSPGGSGGLGLASAQEVLRGMMSSALCDFREETHASIQGVHLDLLRLGREWKRDWKNMLEEQTKELRELREENRLLREENGKLRAGW